MIIDYDAEKPPNPEDWLREDPDVLSLAIEKYHEEQGIDPGEGGMILHALMHEIVENQIAEDIPSVRSAIERLIRQGLSRHDSIHAVASVLSEDIFRSLKGEIEAFDITKYRMRLEKLTAKKWKKGKL